MKRRPRPAPASQKEKVKTFLDERMQQGDEGAYEALQLLRGQVQRGVKQGDHASALETAQEGTLQLLQRGFTASGAEMALQLVEVVSAFPTLPAEIGLSAFEAADRAFNEACDEACSEACGEACNESKGPVAGKADKAKALGCEDRLLAVLTHRLKVLKACVKWSQGRKEVGAFLLGHPRLHALAGVAYWRMAAATLQKQQAQQSGGGGGGDLGSQNNGQYMPFAELAIKHQVLGEQPLALAHALGGPIKATATATSQSSATATSQARGFGVHLLSPPKSNEHVLRRERGAACLRACLQFLAVENLRDGNRFNTALVESWHEESEKKKCPAVFILPTLLKTCERDAATLFTELNDSDMIVRNANGFANSRSTSGPPTTNPAALLRQIGQKFFNIQPPPNMMTTIMSMFGGGANDDDE
eukprot:CAMPEP_0171730770 /NCGR_PEP_ID=MMETSP0991-20121206/28497_1 /TAXON_ID=483369 /ORGANISM="non described non described, Strain CCMP2098" /LENGTH=416 /DNA_ID=CAMNT_0012325583 /DNA_START=16 /DNA_END=1266 /DNA_ORIENTATION=+